MQNWFKNIGKIGWLGMALTTAYLFTLHWYIDGRWLEIRDKELNSIGDFLAGAFGPLAILWLVLGFFQQGIELRQNSSALRLQADELKNSVEQQKQLVQTSKDQLAAEHAALQLQKNNYEAAIAAEIEKAQPKFSLEILSGSHLQYYHRYEFTVKLINTNPLNCTNLRIFKADEKIPFYRIDRLGNGGAENFTFAIKVSEIKEEFLIRFKYYDAQGKEGEKNYIFFYSGSNLIITPV